MTFPATRMMNKSPKSASKNQFGWNARIAAPENGRVRLLPSRQIGESLFADRGKTRASLTKSVVTFDKPLHCLISGNGGPLSLKRIGRHYVSLSGIDNS